MLLGFLAPNGVLHDCNPREHMQLADVLLKKHYNLVSFTPVDKLCQFGWIVIQEYFVGFAGDELFNAPEITCKQRVWLENNRNKLTHIQQERLDFALDANDTLYS